jgi:hypothetical protein
MRETGTRIWLSPRPLSFLPSSSQQDVTAATDSLARIVELARQDMRERGFTDAQIEVLLQRKKAPDPER